MMESAIEHFWTTRVSAAETQRLRGIVDQGNRSGVTAGKNLDGFIKMVRQLITDNGIDDAEIITNSRENSTIPGFYRPTKNWDLLVVSKNKLVAAIEFKSQVGPSFGNNFNNRVEEAIGNAVDVLTTFREGVFGDSLRPFLGYFFVLEDCYSAIRPVKFKSPHFPAMKEFENTSYAQRYDLLCRRLVQENLYDAAALLLTDKHEYKKYSSLSEITSWRQFAISLAAKAAAFSLG